MIDMEPELTNLMEEKQVMLDQLERKLSIMRDFPPLTLHPTLTLLEQAHFATVGIFYLKRDLQIYPIAYGPNNVTY